MNGPLQEYSTRTQIAPRLAGLIYTEASAKSGENVEDAFLQTANAIYAAIQNGRHPRVPPVPSWVCFRTVLLLCWAAAAPRPPAILPEIINRRLNRAPAVVPLEAPVATP